MDTAYKREFKFLGICITENRKMEYPSTVSQTILKQSTLYYITHTSSDMLTLNSTDSLKKNVTSIYIYIYKKNIYK